MKNIPSILFLLSLLFITSCRKENEASTDTVNTYVSSVSNLSTQEPFHEVLIEKKDTLWKHNFWKKEKSFAAVELKDADRYETLLFSNQDTLTLSANFTLYKDLLLFNKPIGNLSFVNTSSGVQIKAKEFSALVEGATFETILPNLKTPNSSFKIKEKIRFTESEITYYWEYYYADELIHLETETVDFSYFEVDNQLFIIPSTDENPYPIYQVTKAENDRLELAYFTDFETKTKSYKAVNAIDSNQYNTYQLCKDSFQSMYYTGDNVRYAKGLEHLLNYLQEGAPKAEGEGFVNIHFTINCNGEVGRFGLELLNRNYQPTNFDPQLIKHIVDKVKLINDWDNLEKISYRGAKDTKMFFLIQVANQQITEVCP